MLADKGHPDKGNECSAHLVLEFTLVLLFQGVKSGLASSIINRRRGMQLKRSK